MPFNRHLLFVCLVTGALACSNKAKPEPPAAVQPEPGSLAKTAEEPSVKPLEVDRTPIPIQESPNKLTLSAATLDKDALEERSIDELGGEVGQLARGNWRRIGGATPNPARSGLTRPRFCRESS